MIEITCTALEKARIITALNHGMIAIKDAVCLFPRKATFCLDQPGTDCNKCLTSKIKWTVVEPKRRTPKKKDLSQDAMASFGPAPTDCQRRWIRDFGLDPDKTRVMAWTPQIAVLFDIESLEARTFRLLE